MLKKATLGLFMILLVSLMSTAAPAQGKQDRVEGSVLRSNTDNSTISVRVRDTDSEKIVHYDSSTKWVSQYHGDKKANTIDASQVKDGDQVICLGTYDDKKEFHANTISKRLSHSPQ
jgi:hypothetical protein